MDGVFAKMQMISFHNSKAYSDQFTISIAIGADRPIVIFGGELGTRNNTHVRHLLTFCIQCSLQDAIDL